ncbi:MAG: TolC family protein [Roseivirga sp.]|nr:TolC family protein [Roseivirga sp.]
MKRLTKGSLTGLMLLLISFSVKAQTEYSLQQSIEYALLNNENILNAELTMRDADAQVFETRADGLPQITGNFNYNNSLVIPRSPIPTAFITGNPADEGVVQVAFGAQHSGNFGINATQMIWDGSFFIGLQAAKMLREKVVVDKVKAEVDVIEQVTKAYYLVLVNETRVGLIDANIANLDSTLRETRVLYENGFAEKIDVSRLQVQMNNLSAERKGVEQGVNVSLNLLKLSMGMPISEEITLTDPLEGIDFEYNLNDINSFSLQERVEVQQINYLRKLAELDIKNTYSQYIPKVEFSAGWGRNTGTNDFSDVWKGDRWFSNSAIGINVSIPIFDGLRKKYTVQRKKIQLQTLDNQYKQLTNSLSQDLVNAREALDVSLERLAVQQANLDLAREVSDITREKYREGVGSNLEVLNAEEDYKESETNYLSALYDAIIAKVDLNKALGKLKDQQ